MVCTEYTSTPSFTQKHPNSHFTSNLNQLMLTNDHTENFGIFLREQKYWSTFKLLWIYMIYYRMCKIRRFSSTYRLSDRQPVVFSPWVRIVMRGRNVQGRNVQGRNIQGRTVQEAHLVQSLRAMM
jgi:hypothetical protein